MNRPFPGFKGEPKIKRLSLRWRRRNLILSMIKTQKQWIWARRIKSRVRSAESCTKKPEKRTASKRGIGSTTRIKLISKLFTLTPKRNYGTWSVSTQRTPSKQRASSSKRTQSSVWVGFASVSEILTIRSPSQTLTQNRRRVRVLARIGREEIRLTSAPTGGSLSPLWM